MATKKLSSPQFKIKEAMKTAAESPILWNELGNIQMDEKLYDDAHESFKKALSLDPEYIDVYNNLANLLKIKGDFQGAFRDCPSRSWFRDRDRGDWKTVLADSTAWFD